MSHLRLSPNLLIMIALIFVTSACNKKNSELDLSKGKALPKNPTTVPTGNSGGSSTTTVKRSVIKDIPLMAEYVSATADLALFAGIDPEYACGRLVKMTDGDTTTNVLELVNSASCHADLNYLPEESEVALRLNYFQSGTKFYLWHDDHEKYVGEMAMENGELKLKDLCTGDYYFESPSNNPASCVMTITEEGLFETLYEF